MGDLFLRSLRADWFLRKAGANVARDRSKEPLDESEYEAARKTRKEADADHQEAPALLDRFEGEQDEEPKERATPTKNQTSGEAVPLVLAEAPIRPPPKMRTMRTMRLPTPWKKRPPRTVVVVRTSVNATIL